MGIFGDIWDALTGNAGDIAVAGIGAGATKYSADMAYKGAKEQNVANAKEALKNRQFQERMSNTSLQRKMADAKAAGINPIAALGGSGAPGVSGAQASMVNARSQSADIISKSVTNAVEQYKQSKEAKTVDINNQILRYQKTLADLNARIAANTYDARVNAEKAKYLADEEEAKVRKEYAREKTQVDVGKKTIPVIGGWLERMKDGKKMSWWSKQYKYNKDWTVARMKNWSKKELKEFYKNHYKFWSNKKSKWKTDLKLKGEKGWFRPKYKQPSTSKNWRRGQKYFNN